MPGAGWGGQRIHCRLPQAVLLGAESFSGAEFLLASSAFSSASLLEASGTPEKSGHIKGPDPSAKMAGMRARPLDPGEELEQRREKDFQLIPY